MAIVLDYSAGNPGGAAVAAEPGVVGVVRYGGTPGRRKNITPAEYRDMDAHGLGVATVYENRAGDALTGRAGGAQAATNWWSDMISIGFPAHRPGYFAVDQDVTAAQLPGVGDYFAGVNIVLGVDRTGAYGERDVIEFLFDHKLITHGWQTVAWSHGQRSKRACLYQRAAQIFVGGIQCDVNDVLAPDWGQHNYQQEDDVSWSESFPVPDGPHAGMKYSAWEYQVWTNFYASQIPQVQAMLATVLAHQQEGLDAGDVLAQLDTSVRAGTADALNKTILPAIERIEAALAADDASEARAIVTELSQRLRPAA